MSEVDRLTAFQIAARTASESLFAAADKIQTQTGQEFAPDLISDILKSAEAMRMIFVEDRFGPDDRARLWLESSALLKKFRRLRNLGYQAAGFCMAHENGANVGHLLQEAVSDFEAILAGSNPIDRPEAGQ